MDRNQRLFEEVIATTETMVAKMNWPEDVKASVNAWHVGGALGAHATVQSCEKVRTAWGKGSKLQAAKLTSIFGLPMVPRYYLARSQNGEMSLEEFAASSLNGLRLMTAAWNDEVISSLTADAYYRLIPQFLHNHRIASEDERHGPSIEAYWLISKCAQALGQQTLFSSHKVEFPVDSMTEFLNKGGTTDGFIHPIEPLLIESALVAGWKAMKDVASV